METEKKELIFVDGFSVFSPREGAPKTIKANVVIRVKDLLAFVATQGNPEMLRIDIRKSVTKGTLYATLNTWKPEKKEGHTPTISPDVKTYNEDGAEMPF